MSMVFDPTGIGKTRCVQAVQQTTVSSVYLRIDHENRIPRTLIPSLAAKVEDDAVTIGAADLEFVERVLKQDAAEQEAIENRLAVSPTALAM